MTPPDARQIAERLAAFKENYGDSPVLAEAIATLRLLSTAEAERNAARQAARENYEGYLAERRALAAAEAQLTEARRQAFEAGFLAAPKYRQDAISKEMMRDGWRFDKEGMPHAADLLPETYAAWLRQTEETR